MHNCDWSEQDFIERKGSSCLSKETHGKRSSTKFRSAVMPHIHLISFFFLAYPNSKLYIFLYHFKTIKYKYSYYKKPSIRIHYSLLRNSRDYKNQECIDRCLLVKILCFIKII